MTSPESSRAISRLAGFLPVLQPREPSPALIPRVQQNLIHTVASFEDEAEVWNESPNNSSYLDIKYFL